MGSRSKVLKPGNPMLSARVVWQSDSAEGRNTAGATGETSTHSTCRTTVAACRLPSCGRTLHRPCPCPFCSCLRGRHSPCCFAATRSHVPHSHARHPPCGRARKTGCRGAGGLVRASAGACARHGDCLAKGCAGAAATCFASASPCLSRQARTAFARPVAQGASPSLWPHRFGEQYEGLVDSCVIALRRPRAFRCGALPAFTTRGAWSSR